MLFKYFPPERIDVLSNLKIRFTQPSSLNDPFEKHKLLDVSEARTEVQIMLQKDIERFEKEHAEMTPGEREQFEQVKLECFQGIDDRITPKSMGDSLMALVDPSIGILSLSRNNKVELMWSHYASAYSGFVIEFDEEHPFFSAPTLDGEKSAPKKVYYSSNRVPVNYNAADWYEQLLCQKSIDWAYEEEIRCFRLFCGDESPTFNDVCGNPVHLIDLPAEMIIAIYIGYRATLETRSKVMNFVQSQTHRCSVFEACPCPDVYGVTFTLLHS